MKKILVILAIVSMIVLDLILSGQSIIIGLAFLAGAALLSFSLDQASHSSQAELPTEVAQ